ncbi:hypothetical protein [Erwinia sorbitola]|uniref:Uncharacterized protein n=1 Tax=Erwinia sorbitola TaxID=2681984 RepID=A0A6I6E931_9GAMM|nr:hypothetical protein [Erwinia sorbitola]MTD27701.1 hypothetical protein [Erwinia sorbitola]QGU86294.1 hypothetical protein GN242_03210 [Erwinia sorbitola]
MKKTPVNAGNLSGLLAKARQAGTVHIDGSSYDERRAQFMKEVLGVDEECQVEGTSHGQKSKNFVR